MAKKSPSQPALPVIIWTIKLVFKIFPVIFVTLVIFQILNATLPFIVNFFYAKIIDAVTKSALTHQSLWITPLVLLLSIRFISSLINHFYNVLTRASNFHLTTKLNQIYIDKISTLDYQHFDNKESNTLIAKVSEEYNTRIQQATAEIYSLLGSLVSFVATIGIIFSHYWYLGVILLLVETPGFFIDKVWIKRNWKIYNDRINEIRIGREIHDQLTSKKFLSELVISNSINFLFSKYNQIFDNLLSHRIISYQEKEPWELFTIILGNAALIVSLIVVITDVTQGQLSVGMFTFYFNAMRSTGDYFSSFLNRFINLSEQAIYLSEFKQVLSLPKIIKNGTTQIHTASPPVIEFKNVSFKYPNSSRYVFKDLNLKIASGEEIALVGNNGAGKTTLIKLLCRFYDPTSGQILINGIDFKQIDLTSWRNLLAILFQEFTTYPNLTLKENIGIGDPQKDNMYLLNEAIKKSESADFTSKYAQGLDTMMSQKFGGEEPSWGQWQKIAIARVFYRDTPIMILDEPTASIDATSESLIFKRLYQQSVNKTLIIVSHRFSTVRNASRIIVLDNGKIVEEGSHEKLLKQKGLYAKSYQLQALSYQS